MPGEPPPTLFGRPLPDASRTFWTTVVGSVLAYLIFGRAVANIFAIVGAVVLTAVLVIQDRRKRERREKPDTA